MKHKEKRKHLEDSHSVVDVHDKNQLPPPEAEPPDDTSGFPSVLVLLREYLGMLSSSNRDKHAELIHQGTRLIEIIEEASRSVPLTSDVRTFENNFRSFTQSVYNFEWTETGDCEFRSQTPLREDTFANFELECLGIIKQLKKDSVQSSKVQIDEERITEASSSKVSAPVPVPKRKLKVKVVFENPRKKLKRTQFHCPHCEKVYESLKSLQNHARADHKELRKVSVHDFVQEEAVIECQLLKRNGNPCTFKAVPSQMGRHVESKKVHLKVHKRPQGTKFRGWRHFPMKTKVAWCRPAEPDPHTETETSDSDDSEELQNQASNDVGDKNKDEVIEGPMDQDNEGNVAVVNSGAESNNHSADVRVLSLPEGFVINQCGHFIHPEDGSVLTTEDGRILTSEDSTILASENGTPITEPVGAILQGAAEEAVVSSCQPQPQSDIVNTAIISVLGDPVPESFSVSNVQLTKIHKDDVLVPTLEDLQNSFYDMNDQEFQSNPSLGLSLAAEDVSEVAETETYNKDFFVRACVSDALLSSTAAPEQSQDKNLDSKEIWAGQDKADSTLLENLDCSGSDTMPVEPIFDDIPTVEQLDDLGSSSEQPSQDSITRENLTPAPSSMKSYVRDMVSNYVTVKVVAPKMTIKKGTNHTIWINPNVDNNVGGNEKQEVNDQLSPPAVNEAFSLDTNDDDFDEVVEETESDSDNLDSDYDENYDVDVETTRNRQERRKVRHLNRAKAEQDELTDQPKNASFISDFMKWLKSITKESTTNENPSTFAHSIGHGWDYFDSFLNFQCSEDPSFNLSRLTDFHNKENFLFIPSPVDWILKANGNALRKSQQLCLHKRLRKYVAFKALKAKFSGQDFTFKMAISDHLRSIDTEVADQNLFSKFDKQYKMERAKKRRMEVIVNPEADQIEYEAVKTFLDSDEAKSLLKEFNIICEDAKKGRKTKPSKFNRVAMICRFFMAIKDKNRPSIYGFTNLDYHGKIEAWLPDVETCIWSLDDLPDKWELYKAPSPGAMPTCFEIRLDGSNPETKGQAATNIIIDRASYAMAEKYQDLKKSVLGVKPGSDPFFVNHRGKRLSRLQKSPGSLVELFGKVVGKPNFRMTNIRKALEGKIQNDKEHSRNTRDINNHSSAVVNVYDNVSASRRNLYISTMGAAEGSSCSESDFQKVYQERILNDKEDKEKMKSEARKYLDEKKNKARTVTDLTPSSLSQEEISVLESIFNDDDVTAENWCKTFYRTVDSLPSPSGKVLRKLEARVFQSQKASILKELKDKEWTGSKEQNSFADEKISSVVRRVLKFD